MGTLFCLGCGHEFPADGARRKQDPVGRVLFGGIGVLLTLAGVAGLVAAAASLLEPRLDIAAYGGLAILAGLSAIGIGQGLGKGFYWYCPVCGKGMALSSESKSAQVAKRKRAQP